MHAHWIEDEAAIDVDTLRSHGVHYERLATEPAAFQAPLDALKGANGYVHQDEVSLSVATPNLDAICAKFVDEHLHTEDEVRFVLEGEGVFDIRSGDDRWMRVTVEAGDLIVVPKDRYHRFFLTDSKQIRCVRLFQDASGWTPVYR
ncbi:MAG: cupin domain-containing protein [Sandaracinaceae bacterium]|nr:cupin domain-containing protein [Sandaracinaceae bacterium]